jgi:hypothetical protein
MATARAFVDKPRSLGAAFLLGLLLQAVLTVVTWTLALALGTRVPALDLAVMAAASAVVTALPLSVNGLGLREGSWAYLFARCGYASGTGVALAWLLYGWVLVNALAGGAWLLVEAIRARDGVRWSPVPPP